VEIEPLERQTLGERAYAQLCDLLVSGRMAPGEKVSLRRAAGALGVSMMPVREAVSRLVADGALEVTPNRSVRVPVMSVAQFRELAGVRVAIEGHAAAEAARLRTDDDLLQIGAVEAAFRRQSTLPDPDAGLSVGLNKDFHFAVYAAAASPLLVEIIRGLWLKAGPVLNLDLRASPERLREGGAVRFHADALAAIRRRDGAAARAAIAADITGAADFIIGRGALAP
jgi:DNA-binding GntR family transcriptional regulator